MQGRLKALALPDGIWILEILFLGDRVTFAGERRTGLVMYLLHAESPETGTVLPSHTRVLRTADWKTVREACF